MIRTASIAAVALVAAAAPASAQQSVNGNVDITGTVAGTCTVVGGASGSSFDGLIALGQLNDADGTLRDDLQGAFTSGYNVRIACTSAPTYSLSTALIANQDQASAPAGYARVVNYATSVTFARAGAANLVVPVASAPGSANGSVGGLLANVADNVKIDISNIRTAGASDILLAGAYEGQITLTITPGA